MLASNPFVNLLAAQKAAVKAARAAGKLMLANWHAPKRVNFTDAHDIKLELDVRCQKLIEKILRAAFPQIPLLGEEGDSGDPNAEYRWVVDPIDGTVNYAFGIPHAAVSIALQGRVDKCGVSEWREKRPKPNPCPRHASRATRHPPRRDLRAVHGRALDGGAAAGRPGSTDASSASAGVPELGDAIIAMGFSKSKSNLEKSLPHLNRLSRRALKVRVMGSAALELAYVASGRLDAYIERTINLWDVAAGALMVECSGGEFYTRPAPGGKFRMVADNGWLRRKLQLGSLLK